jgi:thiamine-phosphate diphosphorylase
MRPVVVMITDRRRFGDARTCLSTTGRDAEERLVRRVAAAAAAGVDFVQVRERDIDGRALARLVTRCVTATVGTRTRVLVNDRLDVALSSGAHGVHLRADSFPAARVRELSPPGFIIGRSVHTIDEAERETERGGLDYLLFGSVFTTASKPGQEPAGVGSLGDVAAATPLPVLAVGGVTADTVGDLSRTGTAGFAGIGLFADTEEGRLSEVITAAVRAFGSV